MAKGIAGQHAARRYYYAHRDEILARRRVWRSKRIALMREREKKWDTSHRGERREAARQWRIRNPELARIKDREGNLKYRIQRRDALRRWHMAHPGMNALYITRRNVRLGGNGGSHTNGEWLEKLSLFASCCAYCGIDGPMERDHKIPLSRGGTDDIANIVPACKSCNSRKHTKTAAEFLALGRAA